MQNPMETPELAPSTSPASLTRPKFPADAGFLAEVRRRVADYFRRTGRRERDQPAMYLKTADIFVWLVGSWALLVFAAQTLVAGPPRWPSPWPWPWPPLGFSIQHDGGHNAYSRRRWVNKLAAVSLDLIGASSYLWKWKHVVIHHTYTNVSGVDTDIEIGSIVRVTPAPEAAVVPPLAAPVPVPPVRASPPPAGTCTATSRRSSTGWMGPHRIPRPRGWDLAVFVGGKLFSVAWMLAIPLFFHPVWLVAVLLPAGHRR